MAIALQKQGVDFLILEKAGESAAHGGTTPIPDCACDVPSHLYSFSFEPKATWSKLFSPQPEILDYLKGVTEKYGLRRYIRFDSLVDRAHWDDSEYRWHVFTTDGQEYVAQFLISGAGALHIPLIPDIEGKDEFRGAAFHSAEWDHGVDLTGKRVAVIGTGASAIQIVPEIVNEVAELQLYQRTPPWVVPRPNKPFPDWLSRARSPTFPGCVSAVRSGIYWFLEGLGFAMTRRPALLRRSKRWASGTSGATSRTRSCAQADADLPGRLQANPELGQLLSGRRRPEDRSDHRRHRAGHARRHRHRRRHRTPGRRHRLRHRLPRHRLVHLPRHQGRAAARTWWTDGTARG